jgi:hypothetical protein
VALAQQSSPNAAGSNNVASARGVVTGDVTIDTASCGSTYLLGGSAFFTVTVPAAGQFPVGCTIRLWNVDPLPFYDTATFLGVIADTTLVVRSGSGPSQVGEALAHAGIAAGTTITACPAPGCGSIGTYSISNPQRLAVATFTGTASGVYLSAASVAGTITIGDEISGSGIPADTVITGQASGTPGGAGIYITNVPTTAAANPVTSIPRITFYGFSGGRGKAIAGLVAKMLYPGQDITITSMGSAGWAQPLMAPRWQLLPSYGHVRFFISPTGSDTAGDGLGGCVAGKPFATLNAVANFIGTQIDLRGDDPVTVQFCPGAYGPGTQQTHFATELPGRNGGAGIRFTGSPGPPENCPSSAAVTLEANESEAVFDTELPYVWILVDCLTLTTQGAAVIEANRGSWIALSTGLAFGVKKASTGQQILALNGGHIVLDSNTILSVFGDERGIGAFLGLGAGALFTNMGGASSGVIWNGGAAMDFKYRSAFSAGQGAVLDLANAVLAVNGSLNGYSAEADESWVYSQTAIPGTKGVALTNGACISGALNQCAGPSPPH